MNRPEGLPLLHLCIVIELGTSREWVGLLLPHFPYTMLRQISDQPFPTFGDNLLVLLAKLFDDVVWVSVEGSIARAEAVLTRRTCSLV